MRLRNLSTFVTVAYLESFHAAANQLHTTQPAISARINALEDELGVKLFIRDQTGTRLSARGIQLLPYAEKILAISHEMKHQISEQQPQKGIMRIGISDTLAYLWLTKLLTEWQTEYPLISFELNSDITHNLITQLENGQLDLVLSLSDQIPKTDLISELLCSYTQKWVGSVELIKNAKPHRIQELAQYPILSFPRNTHPWNYLQNLFGSLDEPPVFHTCTSVTNLLALADQAAGLVLLPEPITQQAIKQQNLIQLPITPPPPNLDFCCTWRLSDDRILPKLMSDSSRKIINSNQPPTR